MQPLRLPGGHQAPAGTYQEIHSGHVIYLSRHGVLPGSPNSDCYVPVGERATSVQQLPRVRCEQG